MMQPPAANCRTPDAPAVVCFALKEEAAPFRKITAGKSDVAILVTGIGRLKAERSVREYLTSNCPKLMLACGFAGGLDPALKLGEVVFELSDSEIRDPRSAIRNSLLAAGAKPATFYCADRIATAVADKRKLRTETGADAIDMESAAIHAVCRERGIPCATVRVISDAANEDLPLDFNRLSKPDQSLDYGKLFLAIAKSPGKIGALIEFHKNTRFAAKQLAAVLAKVTSP
jgi:adenosylhomocysteine nucleosidase